MADREKVIRGLECWLNDDTHCPDDDCPYMKRLICDQAAILNDAISLLKAQEPRVMTYDEMIKAEICFLEVKGIEEIDPFIRYEVDDKSYWSSPYTNNKDNPFELLAEQEEYLIKARCWTSRPTDEQRAATPWAEPPKEG